MSDSPAAASSVGRKSSWAKRSLKTLPGLIVPGQRMTHGTRQPPSQLVSFSLRNGVVPPSGQGEDLSTVVGGPYNDRVVGDPEVVDLLEQLSDHAVVLYHAVGVRTEPGLPLRREFEMREDMHARGVEPDEERLAILVGLVHDLERAVEELLVHGLHTLGVEGASVLDPLLAGLAPLRILRGVVGGGGPAVKDSA